MNQYVTGAVIKKLREKKNMTQAELAARLNVSDKTVSKWETGKGYPDITLIEPLASALKLSVIELLAGRDITNTNRSFNMLRLQVYVCPICGNTILATGETVISCCGIQLPPLEADVPDSEHVLRIEVVDGEYYLQLDHPMTKEHFIPFMAAVRYDGWEMIRLYPEGPAEARFRISGVRRLLWYCNHHGLFTMDPLKWMRNSRSE